MCSRAEERNRYCVTLKDWKNEIKIIGDIIQELTKKTHIQIDAKPIVESRQFIGARHEHKRIKVTCGLLKCVREHYFDREELEAVLGHEFGHTTRKAVFLKRCRILPSIPFMIIFVLLQLWLYKPYDILYLLLVTGPILFLMGRFSWQAEYEADRFSAEITKKPDKVISALRKTREYNEKLKRKSLRNSIRGFIDRLLLHPPTQKRIQRLESVIEKPKKRPRHWIMRSSRRFCHTL